MAILNEHDFEIKHIKGKENKVEYELSFSVNKVYKIAINQIETNILEQIKEATLID